MYNSPTTPLEQEQEQEQEQIRTIAVLKNVNKMELKQKSGYDIADTQKIMLNALIHPEAMQSEDINNVFVDSEQLRATQCLAIYQRSYILRLTKCLAEQFPALNHALGDSLFEQFARQFLEACPSTSYTLYELGKQFSTYLNNSRPDKDLPPKEQEGWVNFMVDLADFERLHFTLFDAHGHEGKKWPTIDVADKHLELQPCFDLGQYRYHVAWYYHTYKVDPDLELPPQGAYYVALLRMDYQTNTFPINRIHFLFLKKLQLGFDIAASLTYVSAEENIPLEQVTKSWENEVRAQWIEAGFFIDKREPDEEWELDER